MNYQEDMDMTLMRVRAAAQLTLPADVRKALNVKEGDYLEAEVVKGGVLLKPVAVVERERAWRRMQELGGRVKDRKPVAGEDLVAKEENIAKAVVKMRRKRRKHA